MILSKDLLINEKHPLSCVYWIYHQDKHTDPRSSGYVGISTKGVLKRFKQHLYYAETGSTLLVHNAMRKYASKIKVQVLLTAEPELCLLMEELLRPLPQMGGAIWNINMGGSTGNLGIKASEETRVKLKEFQACPDRRLKQSERAKAIPAWLHGSSNTLVWASANMVYDCYKAHPHIGAPKLASAFNLGEKQLEAILNKVRTGWIPSEDAGWVDWSTDIDQRIEGGWKVGDALLKRKPVEQTPEIKRARAIGGTIRVWTPEMRDRLSQAKAGVRMSEDAIRRSADSNRGKRRTDVQKAATSERLTSMPWTNATALHDNWAKAEYMQDKILAGTTRAELLREFGLDRKSGALAKITKKIKDGWMPAEDTLYQLWLTQYKQKECNESTQTT